MDGDAGLERFVRAQEGAIAGVLRELRAGRKTGHWIWFVFPQVTGLGHSDLARYYAISGLVEAQAYLAHPVLGARLRDCTQALLGVEGRTAEEILGQVDALKVRSSMTLFHRADGSEPLFRSVLDRYYGGAADPRTDALLGFVRDP